MFKRIPLLMLTIVLLLCSLPVHAEGEAYDRIDHALYRIVRRTAEGDVTLGSGVLFLDQNVILTAESCCKEGNLFAVGSDGEHAVQAMEKAGKSGVVLLELATPSAAEPLMLTDYDTEILYGVFGADAYGNTGAVPLYQVLYGMYRGQDSLVLSAEEGLLPGALVADEKGNVVALTVAQQGEGLGMYAALDSDSLYNALIGSSGTEQFLPLQASWNDGFLNITWTDQVRTDGLYIITVSGDVNTYYTTFEVESTERGIQLAAPPGHTYYMQVQWSATAEDASAPVWSAMTAYTIPETALTLYGFTQECYLASAPAGQEVTDVLPEMSPVTAAALMEEGTARYLQVINCYDVDREIECPMAVELIAPDGQFFFSEHLYLFMPEYETNDCFVLPLDELLATCAEFSDDALPKGEYRVRYSVAGKIAGVYTFTVE